MLVLAVGVREAARQLDIAEGTVLYWSKMGKWLENTRMRPALLPAPVPPGRPINSIKPVDALQKVLQERQGNTKLAQSAYLERASKRLEQVPDDELLEHAPTGKTLAEMASKVWPEVAVDQSTHFAFFSVTCGREHVDSEPQAIDVTPTYDPMDEF